MKLSSQQSMLDAAVYNALHGGNPAQTFTKLIHVGNRLKANCSNEYWMKWLNEMLKTLEDPWRDQVLWIPGEPKDLVMKRLTAQNSWVDVPEWVIHNNVTTKSWNGQLFVIDIFP